LPWISHRLLQIDKDNLDYTGIRSERFGFGDINSYEFKFYIENCKQLEVKLPTTNIHIAKTDDLPDLTGLPLSWCNNTFPA